MELYVVTKGCDDTYVSVWSTLESAQREVDRLNAEYSRKYAGRMPYSWQEDDLSI